MKGFSYSCKTRNNLSVAPLFRYRHFKVLRIVVNLSTLNRLVICSHTSVLGRFKVNLMAESGATMDQKVPHRNFYQMTENVGS